MTGLYTKKVTERMVDKCLAQYPGQRYAFFIFDIDCFKQVNDRFGHAFGDDCICGFTGIIKAHFREDDIIGRIGGDEFVAFIPVPDLEFVVKKAEELSQALDTIRPSKKERMVTRSPLFRRRDIKHGEIKKFHSKFQGRHKDFIEIPGRV